MARVWRPGQQKMCYLYRTLSTGSIEEKVYQRQVTKKALSKSVVEGDVESAPSFTPKDLKDLFKYRSETISDTHDLLNCRCSFSAIRIPRHQRIALKVDELGEWDHFDDIKKVKEDFVRDACPDVISFIFTKFTDKMEVDPNKIVDEEEKEKVSGDESSGGSREETQEDEAIVVDDSEDEEEDDEEMNDFVVNDGDESGAD